MDAEATATARAEWLAMRRSGLGSSDVAAVLGLSSTRTAFDVYCEKRQLVDDTEATERMEWGKELEQVIARKWSRDRGVPITWLDMTLPGPEPWAYATPDFQLAGTNQKEGGDCKNIAFQTDEWGEPETDQVPIKYGVQAQWELLVTEWKVLWLPVLFGGNKLVTYRVDADPKLQQAMLDRAGEFWTDYVLAEEPPPIDWSQGASEYLRSKFPTVKEPPREATPEEAELAAIFARVRLAKKAVEQEYLAVGNQLREKIGDAGAIVGPDFKVQWYDVKGSTYTVNRKPSRVLKGSGAMFKPLPEEGGE